MAVFRPPRWGSLPASALLLLRDAPIVAAGIALFYALVSLARIWATPVNAKLLIELSPRALPAYALFSVARIGIAYLLSLLFAIVYSYAAAHNRAAERLLIPLLDTLQSIPVLSFLPGVMVAMIALMPTRQLGLELGSILLIATGQVWNMAFSAYSSMKTVPHDLLEATGAFRLRRLQTFTQLELPYAAIGLVWNSMMSVAGGWFFLMACEMFVLGNRDLRLPGLGSYLQTAANEGDLRAIAWGVTVMIIVIILLDQIVWRPMIAWSQKFKFEQLEAAEAVSSPILELLRRSRVLQYLSRRLLSPIDAFLARRLATQSATSAGSATHSRVMKLIALGLAAAGMIGVAYATVRIGGTVRTLTGPQLADLMRGAAATFFRVELTLLLSAAWTIPVGVFIGLRPRLAAIAQPIAQIAASMPATALFPIIVLILIRMGGGLGTASIVLLMLGTQWYVLFNVIAGASALPADLREVCEAYRLSALERWRRLLLPGIFPFAITGLVTASGGAWNASVVAEYFRFRGETMSTVGLGAIISRATDQGDFALLLGATILMAAIVVTVNRLVWRRLYALASTRFVLQA
jgi:NitT/TauT family transport system permease protein